jgi:hypothetical protein
MLERFISIKSGQYKRLNRLLDSMSFSTLAVHLMSSLGLGQCTGLVH